MVSVCRIHAMVSVSRTILSVIKSTVTPKGFLYPFGVLKAICMLLLFCFFAWPIAAQNPFIAPQERTDTRTGNTQYEKDNYTDAEANYKKALDKKNNMPEATFNLGDAVYKQKRYDDAAKQFQLSAQSNSDPKVKAQAFHNLGNTYLEQRKWDDAVKSYKESLKLNANDKDTKYNLAYANAMLVQQKQQQQQKKDDKKDKDKDKKDDKKDQQQQQNKKPDSPEDKPGDKDKDKQGKNEQKKAGGQMTKEQAEKLLQALKDEEQKTNQKVQQKQMKQVNVKIQKDW
jgi:Ca-activated chloride channel family protein